MTDESITISLFQFNHMCKDIEELREYKKQQQEKSEYEHDGDVVKAYNDGQTFILDKIRTEIEQLPTKTRINWDGCCPDIDYPEIEYVDVSKEELLEIIDKYKG